MNEKENLTAITQASSNSFSAVLLISFTAFTLLCIIPTTFSYQFQNPPDVEISDTPIYHAIHSNSYLISLISSASMSVHLIVDFVGHSIISQDEVFSYRDSFSKLVILAFLLTPDAAQLFLVIPQSNYVAFMLVRFGRYLSWISATFGYLSRYGGNLWGSALVLSGVCAVDIGFVLKFVSYFNIHLSLVRIIGNSFLGIGILLFLIVTYQHIRQQINFYMKNIQMSSNDYCCNVYLVSFWFTCLGVSFLLIFYDFPDWYQINTNMVVSDTMMFTVYYVFITVFQGKAALVDAIASKVLNSPLSP